MESTNSNLFPAKISEEDWANTPESVKALLRELTERIRVLEETCAHLKEQLKRTSENSSQPPSQDQSKGFKVKRKAKSSKPRGAQPGHRGGTQPELYPVEECKDVIHHYPEHCCDCGHPLTKEDALPPLRHQIVDIPPLQPEVIEHQFHTVECPECGTINRAYDAKIINGSRYGVRLCALVGLLSGEYRQTHRMVLKLLSELFDIDISVGSVGNLRKEMSEAIAQPVSEAHEYVKQQAHAGVDETSFTQGNADGNNPKKTKGWLWVIVTPLVCYFQVFLSRAQAAAQTMLGAAFGGTVNSDRCPSYNWLKLEQRQLCWAHLKRDFIKISERGDPSKQLGEALLEQERLLFELWHRFKGGSLTRTQLISEVAPIRQKIKELLSKAAAFELEKGDKSLWAKTVRTCRQLLKVEPAFWLFVNTEGVEPTNNAAEQAIRPAVLWRRCSYGSQSAKGSLFVGRMLTVVATLRCQKRKVFEYLVEACRAKRNGEPAPSLLPNSSLANAPLNS